MPRFLSTLPTNIGFYNLGSVETYPTGGSGPTAYGPTSYFGSDPLPSRGGDSINNPIDLGNFTAVFKSVTLSNKHGGKSRIQSTFYSFFLTSPQSVQLTQNYSPTSYQEFTNRNTIISIYKVEYGNHRVELPINDSGYVYKETSIVDDDSYSQYGTYQSDYPSVPLDAGTYIIVITNDIRYLETTYSFTVNASLVDWGSITEAASSSADFITVTEAASALLDFGDLTSGVTSTTTYPYSSTSGLGYTRAGVSP